MDKITNNIINNLPKKEIKENNKSLNDLANSSPSVDKVMSSNVVDIKDTKKLESLLWDSRFYQYALLSDKANRHSILAWSSETWAH